ncbi:hypothetical protein AB6A40_002827 [Gnathostoma spinigerum]|uniref:Transcription factor CBF/NF-Y/archaeal histone domain-containing protein n=1 Tax=Gnathostoma spinigerum TaxID=75299 RepID=A0ABD6E7Q5_9BILA
MDTLSKAASTSVNSSRSEASTSQMTNEVIAQAAQPEAYAQQTARSDDSQYDRQLPQPNSLYDVYKELSNFWPKVKEKIDAMDHAKLREANRHQELPLARIKKIMKLDENVKHQMISAEVPVLLAKASELFIEELTLRSWKRTEESKRKTLQKIDICQAVSRNEMYDFLIDIVPREDTRRTNSSSYENGAGDRDVSDEASYSTADPAGNNMFVLQVGAPEGSLVTGGLVQATPIGQPIQLQATNQPIQLIALGFPNGEIQHFQVQLPSS